MPIELQYHVVIVTKYRHRVLNPVKFNVLAKKILTAIITHIDEVELIALNVQPEHVHMLIIIPPKYAVSKVIETIKSRSAKMIRKEIPWLDKPYYGTPSMWTVGYFVSTVGIDETIIKNYVLYQNKQDSAQAKLDL